MQKSEQREREHHSYPECVTGSTHEHLLYLVVCGTLQLPMRLSKRRCKAPIQEQGCNVVALETEAGKHEKSAMIMNIIQRENMHDVNGSSSMVVQKMNIIQHENMCEVNLAVQSETDATVKFVDPISAVDTSGSLLVTGRFSR